MWGPGWIVLGYNTTSVLESGSTSRVQLKPEAWRAHLKPTAELRVWLLGGAYRFSNEWSILINFISAKYGLPHDNKHSRSYNIYIYTGPKSMFAHSQLKQVSFD